MSGWSTTTLPDQGLGIVARAFVSDHFYLSGGVNDANGTPNKIDFESFFGVREYFTWIEAGWSPNVKHKVRGDSIHLTVWHSDARIEAEVPESWGIAFSASRKMGDRWIPFIRRVFERRRSVAQRVGIRGCGNKGQIR